MQNGADNATKNYRKLRARLYERGFTLRSWALAHSIPVGSVYGAMRGTRNGVAARRIRQQLKTLLHA